MEDRNAEVAELQAELDRLKSRGLASIPLAPSANTSSHGLLVATTTTSTSDATVSGHVSGRSIVEESTTHSPASVRPHTAPHSTGQARELVAMSHPQQAGGEASQPSGLFSPWLELFVKDARSRAPSRPTHLPYSRIAVTYDASIFIGDNTLFNCMAYAHQLRSAWQRQQQNEAEAARGKLSSPTLNTLGLIALRDAVACSEQDGTTVDADEDKDQDKDEDGDGDGEGDGQEQKQPILADLEAKHNLDKVGLLVSCNALSPSEMASTDKEASACTPLDLDLSATAPRPPNQAAPSYHCCPIDENVPAKFPKVFEALFDPNSFGAMLLQTTLPAELKAEKFSPYALFERFDAMLQAGKDVFVHCQQGVRADPKDILQTSQSHSCCATS